MTTRQSAGKEGAPDNVGVLFVQPYGQVGGAERYLDTLLERLGPGWVDEVVFLQPGRFLDRLSDKGLPVSLIDTGPSMISMLASAARLRKKLRREGVTVVHANGIKAALVAGIAVLGTKTKVVWVKHDFSWDGAVANIAAALSFRVIGVSKAATETLWNRRPEKIRTVYNGVEVEVQDRRTARAALRHAVDAGDDARIVSIVGRLHEVKGHRDMLEIAASLRELVPRAHIAFIGGEDPSVPGYAREIKQRIDEGLTGIVHLVGFREDAETMIAGSDVVAIPSGRDARGMGREAFPTVALEALSLGVPVIAYADGGVPELLGDCGSLIPPGDRQKLLEVTALLLADDSLREQMARRGRERSKLFHVEPMVEAMRSVYREAAQ